jgi:hypothetical protein
MLKFLIKGEFMRKDKIIKKLPNPFIFNNGKTVNSIADWDERRNEI